MLGLWLTSIGTTGLLLLSAVASRFFILAAYCAATFARDLILFRSAPGGEYYQTWLFTEPVMIGLRAGVAIEAYLRVAEPYREMGWWKAGVPIAAVSIASAILMLAGADTTLYPSMATAVGLARSSWFILALGLTMAWFVAVVPASRPAVVIAHYWMATGYAYSQAIPYGAMYAFGPGWVPTMSAVSLGLAAAIQLAWSLALLRWRQPARPPVAE